MSAELPPIERLQALRLEPGDTLVVKLAPDGTTTAEMVDRWREMFRQALGDHPVLFIVGDVEFEVVHA